jgi:hypothetical protein
MANKKEVTITDLIDISENEISLYEVKNIFEKIVTTHVVKKDDFKKYWNYANDIVVFMNAATITTEQTTEQ